VAEKGQEYQGIFAVVHKMGAGVLCILANIILTSKICKYMADF
jgi:hypothetical protein